MNPPKTKESIQIFYVRWSSENPMVCAQCGAPVEFLYNDGGRIVITLQGKIKLYTYYYTCTNRACSFAQPFTLPQEVVLPYKHFGLDVWWWVITSHVEFHDAPSAIAKRLKAYYDLDISPNTVKAIIETFLVANSEAADQETLRLIQASGKIILSLDGQRPNNGESGLWLFIDTITNRIVHMAYLKFAGWEVLAEIFRKIEQKYSVPIQAILSDHQQSIIKAVKEVLPQVPHQFCHYHFVKNLQRTINALDAHLHVTLSIAINDLYICHLPPAQAVCSYAGQELNLRTWLTPLVMDLSQLLLEKTRDFDIFAGFNLYEQLGQYIDLLDMFLEKAKPIERLTSLLERTSGSLKQLLARLAPLYTAVKTLIPLFNELRAILGGETAPKAEIRAQATQWRDRLQTLYIAEAGRAPDPKMKFKRITAEASLTEVLAEWIRLYSTHERGLFQYLEIQGLPRSNVALEQLFSLESHHFRVASGNAQVGNLVRVKGGELCIALQSYDPDRIKETLIKSDRITIKPGLEQFRQRHKIQAASWHRKQSKPLEIHQLVKKIEELLSKS